MEKLDKSGQLSLQKGCLVALRALLKQLKGNKTRRPAKELCLKQHVKKKIKHGFICAHWFRHSPCTRAGRPPAKPLWFLIEKKKKWHVRHIMEACFRYLRACCVIIYWRALPVYMLILREGHVLSIELFSAAREDPDICLFWTVHVHLCWAENEKNIPSSDVLKILSAS